MYLITKDIIIAAGGPFEFGAHEFSEAELSSLGKGARSHSLQAVERLRTALNCEIPTRRYESNLLMANWTLRRFGSLREKRLTEIRQLMDYLRARAQGHEMDLFLLGDFQLEGRDSEVHSALVEGGLQIPESILQPASANSDRYYSLIGYLRDTRSMPLAGSGRSGGVFRTYDHATRDQDLGAYSRTAAYRQGSSAKHATQRVAPGTKQRARRYRYWRTLHLSDHLSLWVELDLPGKSPDKTKG